ncbi:CPBP family intramembrane glutamic endopeptidase [Loktanella sp. D2R18]|uniref:CPBP family intramembrane glutamic endopeptidase n=2 Tax=Rhodobacterales TaxID=204455 RepID=UPI00215DB5F3|nr:CPBP family intramembrane glutamic endopeptidase [Loktanella sp. D2R18]MDO6590899.1 CPBP family intramembrane metalloprotease [Yoonia sp. 1_MG-2023]
MTQVRTVLAAALMRGLMSRMSDPYAPHQSFIAAAARRAQLWRIVFVVVGFELIFALSSSIVAEFLAPIGAQNAYVEGVSTFGTLMQFLTFGIGGAGLVMLVNLLHGRGFWTMIGPVDAAWRDLVAVTLAVAAVLCAQELLPPWYDFSGAKMRPLMGWVALIPITLFVLLVQVGTEELMFRGYLQQQLANLSSRRWVWMGIPSVLFGGLHYWNGHGAAEGALWAFWAAMLGAACADLTARSGNLGPAIGLHLANNAFAILLYAIAGWPGSGVALFLFPYEDPASYSDGIEALMTPWVILQMAAQFLSVLVMWLAARIAIRR